MQSGRFFQVVSKPISKCLWISAFYILRRFYMVKKVAVIMGSDSDLPVVKGAISSLKLYEIPFDRYR